MLRRSEVPIRSPEDQRLYTQDSNSPERWATPEEVSKWETDAQGNTPIGVPSSSVEHLKAFRNARIQERDQLQRQGRLAHNYPIPPKPAELPVLKARLLQLGMPANEVGSLMAEVTRSSNLFWG